MGKEKNQKNRKNKAQKQTKKQTKKTLPKKKSLKIKLLKLLLLLTFIFSSSGIGHFYLAYKRMPKTGKDFQIILQNLSTAFFKTVDLAQQQWKEWEKKYKFEETYQEILASLEEELLKENNSTTKNSTSTNNTNPNTSKNTSTNLTSKSYTPITYKKTRSSHQPILPHPKPNPSTNLTKPKPNPIHSFILQAKQHIQQGIQYFKEYKRTRKKEKLHSAEKEFQLAKEKLQKAQEQTNDPQRKQSIEENIAKVNRLLLACKKAHGFF